MSVAEETAQENDQREPEIRLQEGDGTDDFDPEKNKNTRMKQLLKISQRDRKTISPLSLFKEDFSQLKEEVLKVFRDKDTKTEHEDHPSIQAENKQASSTLDLLKEDFSHFKEDVTSVFSISSSKDKETKSAEKTINRLSFLKEDFNNLKDDLSNVFRIGQSKERDAAKEDSTNTVKVKDLKAERTHEPSKSLFRRDQKISQQAGNGQGVKKTCSGKSEEQMDGSFRGNFSEQNRETADGNMKDRMTEVEDSEVDITGKVSETQQREEVIPTSQAGGLEHFHCKTKHLWRNL